MDNASLAAQAVANSPGVIAPASFNGVEWLVALNLWAMTAAFLVALMVIATLLTDGQRYKAYETPGVSPARTWRWIGLLVATGIMLRCGAEALTLWGWDIEQPAKTGTFLFIKRLIDPFAVASGVTAMILFVLSLPGIMHQLRREPLPFDMWQAWPTVRRMLCVAVLCFVAAVGVTVTR